MARIKLLIDTDIFIDYLKGISPAKAVFRSRDIDISLKYSELLAKYHDNRLQPPDAIIAATAWSKKLPLLTRNRRHFSYIEEIKLSPIYD